MDILDRIDRDGIDFAYNPDGEQIYTADVFTMAGRLHEVAEHEIASALDAMTRHGYGLEECEFRVGRRRLDGGRPIGIRFASKAALDVFMTLRNSGFAEGQVPLTANVPAPLRSEWN